ncbi:DUF4153 domain-containing protein [Butyrivibrio proteoclasticus]|uniref:DUF4153 domain-containing protein n=1 Tax=Butyrivibrio proteoclasticus TaxID=43305 RepID=UPI00047C9F35|nr:DUF4153 domain-containing protein [Butyrivibrio proteoclasticus]
MKIFGEIKQDFKNAVSEHLISMVLFLLAMICAAFYIDAFNNSRSHLLRAFEYVITFTLIGASMSVLLCENIHHCFKNSGIIKTIISIIILIVGIFDTFILAFVNNYTFYDLVWPDDELSKSGVINIIYDISIVVYVSYIALILYFFYKQSGEEFESYVAKAFCGVMKAEILYFIIAIGSMLILGAIDVLISDFAEFELYAVVQVILLGLVAFPCGLIGLSKTQNEISRFGKAVIGYVFTALLAIAFLIIYIYIIKILVTWTFPKNEVFTILAVMFSFGLFIWTMAMGCVNESLKKPIACMPFFFMPFIILQIICVSMRIRQYGFTSSRYFGVAFIVFELIYSGVYIYKFVVKKDIMGLTLIIISIMSFLMLLAPFVNVHSVVFASQKANIEKYLVNKDTEDEEILKNAYESYKAISNDGGFQGQRYLDKNMSQEDVDIVNGSAAASQREWYYIGSYSNAQEIDVAGYSKLIFVHADRRGEDLLNSDLQHIDIYSSKDEEFIGTVDIKDIANELVDIDKKDVEYDIKNEMEKELLSNVLVTFEGDTFVITDISFNAYEDSKGIHVLVLDMEGYILKN